MKMWIKYIYIYNSIKFKNKKQQKEKKEKKEKNNNIKVNQYLIHLCPNDIVNESIVFFFFFYFRIILLYYLFSHVAIITWKCRRLIHSKACV